MRNCKECRKGKKYCKCKKATAGTVTSKQIQDLRKDIFGLLKVLHDDAFEYKPGLVNKHYEAIMNFKDSN